MKEIRPSFEIMDDIDGAKILQKLERCGRVCYKSEDKITEGSAEKFIGMILKSGHESVLEHEKLTVKFICDRGVTHEIVLHICALSDAVIGNRAVKRSRININKAHLSRSPACNGGFSRTCRTVYSNIEAHMITSFQ